MHIRHWLDNRFTLKQIPFYKFIPGIVWFVVVLILICLPKEDIPHVNRWFLKVFIDKWVHAIMFGLMAWLFMNPIRKASTVHAPLKQQFFLRILIITIAWSYVTECIQLFVPGRSYDLLDWLADSSGAVIAFMVCKKRCVV